MKKNEQLTTDHRIYADLNELVRLKYKAKGFSFLPKQPIRSLLSGNRRSKLRGRGLDFIELRHYRIGDDIRSMDWKVTNRTKKPHVRVYAEEKDRPVYIVVDQRMSMFFGSQWKMKSVIASELAAIAAWRVLDGGDRVGAVLFNDERIEKFKPSRSEPKLLHAFSRLLKMNHALSVSALPEKQIRLDMVLTEVENLTGHDYLVVLISDFHDWDEAALKSLKRIARHNDVVAGMVLDPLEQDVGMADQLIISDGEYQFQIDAGADILMDTYKTNIVGAINDIINNLKRHNVPLIPINTTESVDLQLQRALGHLK